MRASEFRVGANQLTASHPEMSSSNCAFLNRLVAVTSEWKERAELTVSEMRELDLRLNIVVEKDLPDTSMNSSVRFAPFIWDKRRGRFTSRCLFPSCGIYAR